MTAGEIWGPPFEPLNLGRAQPGKRAARQTRHEIGIACAGCFEQPGNLNRLEYLDIAVADLELFNTRNRIVGSIATRHGELEECVQYRAIVAVALRGKA